MTLAVDTNRLQAKRPSANIVFKDTRARSPFWLQFCALYAKLLLQANKNKIGFYIQLFHHIGCSLVIGCLFYDCGNDGARPFNQVKFYITVIVFYTYTQSVISILQYPLEVNLLRREHFNQWYSLFPYYLAYTAVKAYYMVPFAFIFTVIAYALSGLPWEFERFSLFFLTGVMLSSTSEAFGLVIGTLFSVTNGSMVGPMTLTPIFGLAIYGIDFSRAIGPLMGILVRSSFMRAARTCLFLVAFTLDREKLDCSLQTAHCFFNDPRVFLYHLDLEKVTLWHAFGDLFLNLLFYRVAFYLALKWRLRN